MNNIITGDIFTVVSDLRAELETANAEIKRLKHIVEMAKAQNKIERGNWGALLTRLGIEGPHDEQALIRGGDEIGRLQSQLAETWQPVERGEYTLGDEEQGYLHILDVLKDGDAIGVSDKEVLYYVDLGDYRLCSKAATVEAEPVDWGKCDKRRKYFAIDDDGEGYAFDSIPNTRKGVWYADAGSATYIGTFNLNAIDWRATLTERPNQPKGVTRG